MLQRHCSAAPRRQLKPSAARASRGDALTQLLSVSLTLKHVTDYYERDSFYPLPRHFLTLYKAVQVNAAVLPKPAFITYTPC